LDLEGNLAIRGDSEGNAFAVTLQQQQVIVASLDGSTLVNGALSAAFDAASLTGDLTIRLGPGDNQIRIGGESHEEPSAATIAATSAEDEGHEEPRLTVPGKLSVSGGQGDDAIAISFVSIGSDLTIYSGAGDDAISLGRGPGFGPEHHADEAVAAAAAVASEASATEEGCGDSGTQGPPADVRIGGTLRASTGPGDDRLKVAFAAAERVALVMGPGDDLVVTGRGPLHGVHGPGGGEEGCGGSGGGDAGCGGDTGCGGSHADVGAAVDAGALAADATHGSGCGDEGGEGGGGSPHRRPPDFRVGADFALEAGAGDDVVMLRNTVVDGALSVRGGAGADAIGAQNLRVHGEATLRDDVGDNLVALRESTFKGAFHADLGSHADVMLLSGVAFRADAKVDMGVGDDLLLLDKLTTDGGASFAGGEGYDAIATLDGTSVPMAYETISFERTTVDPATLDEVFAKIDAIFSGFLMGRGELV
jgi:hypothetical protein